MHEIPVSKEKQGHAFPPKGHIQLLEGMETYVQIIRTRLHMPSRSQ